MDKLFKNEAFHDKSNYQVVQSKTENLCHIKFKNEP